MKPVLFLRIASVLTLIHAALHTVGGVFGKVKPGPEMVAADAMKANAFPLMGHVRSFWDFYLGMGLAVSIFLFFGAILFWQLGSLAKTDAIRLRPVLITLMGAYLAMAVNSQLYFFAGPVITEILIAGCLLASVFTAESAPQVVQQEKLRATV
jgi:hypothetical protein